MIFQFLFSINNNFNYLNNNANKNSKKTYYSKNFNNQNNSDFLQLSNDRDYNQLKQINNNDFNRITNFNPYIQNNKKWNNSKTYKNNLNYIKEKSDEYFTLKYKNNFKIRKYLLMMLIKKMKILMKIFFKRTKSIKRRIIKH